MFHQRKMRNLMIPVLLLISSLLSACQNGPKDQVQACNQKSLPIVKTLGSVQASSLMVYASNGYDLYAFDAGNGTSRWCNAISVGNKRDKFADLTYSRGSVYAYTNAGDIASFQAGSGTFLWSNYAEHLSVYFTPPPIINTTVYGGTKSIYALNTQDGSVRWHYALPDQTYANFNPIANNGSVYFSVNAGESTPEQVYALDAETGNKRWIFSHPENEFTYGQLAASDGVVVFPYQKESSDGAPHFGLDALNAQNGKLLWQKAIGLPMNLDEANKSWAIANGLLYVIGDVPDNHVNSMAYLYALDIHTGAIRWSLVTDEEAINGSLLVADNILYSINALETLSAFNAQTGQLLWHAQLQLHPSYRLLSQLDLLNDHLFIGTEDILEKSPVFLLHAFNLNTHKEDWYANISGDAAQYSPMIVGE